MPPAARQGLARRVVDLCRRNRVARRLKIHKDILPPRALLQRQISSNAPVPYL